MSPTAKHHVQNSQGLSIISLLILALWEDQVIGIKRIPNFTLNYQIAPWDCTSSFSGGLHPNPHP